MNEGGGPGCVADAGLRDRRHRARSHRLRPRLLLTDTMLLLVLGTAASGIAPQPQPLVDDGTVIELCARQL